MNKSMVTPIFSAAKKWQKILKAALVATALGAFPGSFGVFSTAGLYAAEAAADNWVYLDGSQSSDDYGANLRYHWRQVGGTRVVLEDGTTAKPRFLPPAPGIYSFELIVSNGEASSKPAIVDIEVDRANTPPTAVLPLSLNLTLGENLVLDGSRSNDADNDPLTYNWRQISGTALLSEVAARQSRKSPTITLKPATAGIYEFELTVSDGREESAPRRCRVQVVRPVSIPVARVSAPRKTVMKFSRPAVTMAPRPEAKPMEKLTERDDEDLTQNLPQIAEPETNATARPEPTPRPAPVARITAPQKKAAAVPALTAREVAAHPASPAEEKENSQINRIDNAAKSLAEEMTAASEDFAELTPIADITPVKTPQLRVTPIEKRPQIKIHPVNRRPAATEKVTDKWGIMNVPPVAAVKGNITAETGQKVLLEGMGTDVDGDAVTYKWKQTAGPVIPGNPGNQKNIAFIPQEAGVYIFELTVNDGKIDSAPAACAVTVIDAELENVTAQTPRPAESAPAAAGYSGTTPKVASTDHARKNRLTFWK